MCRLVNGWIAATLMAGLGAFPMAAAAQQETPKPSTPPAPKTAEPAGAKIGEPAPNFTLTDTEGKTWKLSDHKGKIVVLEWFNPECPVVMMHYENRTMHKVQEKFRDKNIVWVAINSGYPGEQGTGKEKNAQARTEWKMTWPVLLDESGTVGRTYGAKTTPHMFVINANGVLVYAGAIDDGSPRGIGQTNYVENAIDKSLKGETVSPATTRPYGCNVKYRPGS